MSQEQINYFQKIDGWVQDRLLFNDRCSWSLFQSKANFFGGESYEEEFSSVCRENFRQMMNHLQNDDIYLDIGAGDGHAIHQYRDLYPDGAKVIGIAATQPSNIERVIKAELTDKKFTFFLANFKEFPTSSLIGRVSFITDIKGGFLYALDPALVIQKMGALLKVGAIAIICFGYGIGINPSSQIKNENLGPNSLLKQVGSKALFHLWFHTIQGFDILHQNMDLEASNKVNQNIMEKPETYHEHCFGGKMMVLKRNHLPIQVDELIPNPDFITKWSQLKETEKNYDHFWPRYTWKTSDASTNLLSKIKWLNH